jgi:hypothetical protein
MKELFSKLLTAVEDVRVGSGITPRRRLRPLVASPPVHRVFTFSAYPATSKEEQRSKGEDFKISIEKSPSASEGGF